MNIKDQIVDLKDPQAKKDDEKSERILRKLGFKPGQFITWMEIEEKWKEIVPNEKMENMSDLLELLVNSHVLQQYFRFISNAELKELKEIQGRT